MYTKNKKISKRQSLEFLFKKIIIFNFSTNIFVSIFICLMIVTVFLAEDLFFIIFIKLNCLITLILML